MIKMMWVAALAGFMAVGVVACGGGNEAESNEGATMSDAQNSQSGATMESGGENTAGSEEDAGSKAEDAGRSTPAQDARYQTKHDPNAFYTLDDLTMEGSYLKIDFGGLSPNQLNRVIHRLRTEYCTCGCKNDTIDQCLVNDPGCGTAVTLTNQVIREERLKS